ncbi:MAG: FAD-dependent oxidoreductase, partial [Dehalococcoidia bacterium]|nr:FAD-dependent oxidoreductase [Dehalococcoidia bacterium]
MKEEEIPVENQGVVIVGAGVAGLTAALAAVEAGAKTLVVEKAPDISDTNTSRSGGAIAFAKEKEMHPEAERLTTQQLVDEARKLSRGHCLPELVKTWRENIDDTLQWLQKAGLRVSTETGFDLGGSSVRTLGGGAGLNKQLLAMAQKAGVNVLFSTRAEKLLRDNRGKAVGIRALTSEGLKDFMASGVVLATAGFQANQEMLMKYHGADFAYG